MIHVWNRLCTKYELGHGSYLMQKKNTKEQEIKKSNSLTFDYTNDMMMHCDKLLIFYQLDK